MKYTLPLAGFFLALGVMMTPAAPVIASEAENSEDLQEAAINVRERLESRITELQALKSSGASDIEIRLATADDILDTTESNILEAKTYIPYVLFLNTQEKRAVYSLTTALLGQVRVYHNEVNTMQENLSDGVITEETANTNLNTLVDDTVAYLEAHKEDFSDKIKQTLKLRVKAAKTYIGFGIDFTQDAMGSYTSLYGAEQTNTAYIAVTKAQAAYGKVADLYAAGIDGTDDDIQQLRQAGVQLIIARRQLSKAEYRLLTLENDWTTTHPTEDLD